MTKHLMDSHITDLERDVSTEEIQAVVFGIHPDKAPGPDGFNGHFFRKAWHIIGDDVVQAISSFFSSGQLLKGDG